MEVNLLGPITDVLLLWKKLDRVLMNNKWEIFYPLVTVQKITREKSKHNILLLSSNIGQKINKAQFHFELSQFGNNQFKYEVQKIWEQKVTGNNILDVVITK